MRWLPEIRERCCGYVALVEELVKAIGAKGSILAQQLWELAPSIRDYITKAIDALPAVPTAEEIASALQPSIDKCVSFICQYGREPAIALLKNDMAVQTFARFSYGLLPDSVQRVVKEKTWINACSLYAMRILATLQEPPPLEGGTLQQTI
jgi:hypothetical protein